MTFGYSRQAYYKHQKLEGLRCVRDQKVLTEVRNIRKEQPKVGGRKLHIMLSNLEQADLKIGRDYLFEMLAQNNLLIKRRLRFTRTTDSGCKPVTYPNLMKMIGIEKVNQAWVVDITYINTCSGFAYLYLITDRYSRKIMSHVLADSLKAKHACSALLKAISTINNPEGIIHHSDHGSQYCSDAYQNILKANNMLCSMTGAARCYDNAVAERINGILKQELGLGMTIPSLKIARELADNAIYIYNNKRLHASLKYKTPSLFYHEGTKYQHIGGINSMFGDVG